MPEQSIRPIEIDPETSRWLAQLDEDPDEIVNELLHKYRSSEDNR